MLTLRLEQNYRCESHGVYCYFLPAVKFELGPWANYQWVNALGLADSSS